MQKPAESRFSGQNKNLRRTLCSFQCVYKGLKGRSSGISPALILAGVALEERVVACAFGAWRRRLPRPSGAASFSFLGLALFHGASSESFLPPSAALPGGYRGMSGAVAGGGPGPVAQGLKEALVETLNGILCPVQGVRAAAEEQVKVLEVTEEFGVHLAELTVDPQGALAIRQLASVILKQYVETHWCSQSDKFRPPETTERAKAAIRELLPNGLRESISKVRSSVAYAVSAIAHWDWPEAWPELFNLLMEMLVSGDLNAVHGAMRVLTEFTREVTDTQMPLVAPVILPEMYKIFTMAEVYGIRTRSRAVEIFTTCAQMICNMEELEKGAAKVLIFPVVQQFTEAFVQALQMPDGPTSDSGLKMEVLKAVTALVKNYPRHMISSMQQILPIVWNTLTESAALYPFCFGLQ